MRSTHPPGSLALHSQLVALGALAGPLDQHLAAVLGMAVVEAAVAQGEVGLQLVAGFGALVFVVFGELEGAAAEWHGGVGSGRGGVGVDMV